MASTDGGAHNNLTLTRHLILFIASLASIQELDGLLGTLIRINLHAFVATHTADYPWLLAATVVS